MRTLTKMLLVAAFAMAVGSTANANVVINLAQVGGTYNGVMAAPSDTLTLQVQYTITGAAENINLIDPALAFPTNVATFVSGYETGFAAWSGGAGAISPIAAIWTVLSSGAMTWVDGLEKATTGTPANAPCVFGACTSLGSITLHLTGVGGLIDLGAILPPLPGGTIINSTTAGIVTGLASLGSFTIVGIPEPTTASLLGLGLVGLTVAGRRRKS